MNTLERLMHWNIMQPVKTTLDSKHSFVPGSVLSSSDPFSFSGDRGRQNPLMEEAEAGS